MRLIENSARLSVYEAPRPTKEEVLTAAKLYGRAYSSGKMPSSYTEMKIARAGILPNARVPAPPKS